MQYVFLDLTSIGDLIINTKRTYIFHVNDISELYRVSQKMRHSPTMFYAIPTLALTEFFDRS